MARSQGMSTLLEEAVRLIGEGVTTVAEVMRAIYIVGV
jgi:type IV pilus assembly protein PilB